MSTDRYSPRRMRSGAVAQSGLDLREKGTRRSLLNPADRPFRAIVVNQRVVGEAGHVRGLGVECDVILVRTQIAIQNVPVQQRQHGVNNVHDLWVPRPTTRVVGQDGTAVNLTRTHSRRGTFIAPGTPLGDIDGDMVLVDFIEGNQDYPIITGALTHERTNRVVRAGVGWREGEHDTRGNPRRDEYYVHHMGLEIRVNDRGELLIDSVGAYSDPATEDAGASVGQIRVRVKGSQRFTIAMGNDEDVFEVWKDGDQLRIDLGAGATEKLLLGDSWRTFFNGQFKSMIDAHTHLPGTMTVTVDGAPVSVQGASGAPVQSMPEMSADLLSDLARTKKT